MGLAIEWIRSWRNPTSERFLEEDLGHPVLVAHHPTGLDLILVSSFEARHSFMMGDSFGGIMRQFFRGWRKKLGIVTLLLALVFTAGWIRSFTFTDWLGIRLNKALAGMTLFAIESHRGELGWQDLTMFENYIPIGWTAEPLSSHKIEDERFRLAFASVAYWWIVTPLILLSMYLLFSKPRRSIQQKIAEPAPAGGV